MSDDRDVPEDFAAEGLAGLPSDLAADVQEYADTKNLDDDAAIRKLLRDAIEQWRVDRAVEQLDEDEISFSRAVEIANTTPWELADQLDERGIQWVSSDHLSHDLGQL